MAYEYDIFVSYRRTPTVGQWVNDHLVPRLEARLNDVAPVPVRISCDNQMEGGVKWPDELKRRLRVSGLLVCVWSADYFRSEWCMIEWLSFKERENELNMFSGNDPRGLVYPVRYADGDHFHPDAQQTQCRKDFSGLNYPDQAFKLTPKYIEFDDLVQAMAKDLVDRLKDLPAWRADFPVVKDAKALPAALLTRPIL